jgi:hypothetical protein
MTEERFNLFSVLILRWRRAIEKHEKQLWESLAENVWRRIHARTDRQRAD